jgi:hypothetical protein
MKWAKYRLQEAQFNIIVEQHQDSLTRAALLSNKILSAIIGIPVIPLQLVTTFILGIVVRITFGVFLLFASIIWCLFLVPLLGSSWLWLKFSPSRIILFIPGIIWASISGIYVALMPSMGEWDSRYLKLGMCDYWPLSWEIWRHPEVIE